MRKTGLEDKILSHLCMLATAAGAWLQTWYEGYCCVHLKLNFSLASKVGEKQERATLFPALFHCRLSSQSCSFPFWRVVINTDGHKCPQMPTNTQSQQASASFYLGITKCSTNLPRYTLRRAVLCLGTETRWVTFSRSHRKPVRHRRQVV